MDQMRIRTDQLEDNLYGGNKITDKIPVHQGAPQFGLFNEPLAMLRVVNTNAATCPRPHTGGGFFFPQPNFQGAAAWP